MLTKFKRIFKFAMADFYRNRGISLAAIFILIITILTVTGLFLMHGIGNFIISEVENKIDITAYFKSATSQDDIMGVKNQIIAASPSIKSVEYVSKEDALADFIEKHKDDPTLQEALDQVGDNPFLPSLSIVTSGEAAEYEKVANILKGEQFSSIIEKVDYSQKKDIIDKVFSITSRITTFGLAFTFVLVLVVMLVVYNTLKLAIDHSKDEITTMRIVGASSSFVRAPFIIQGAMFGVIAFVVCFVITAVASLLLSGALSVMMPGFSLFHYFLSNLFLIALIQLGFGTGLGIISSVVAVNRYLKL
ncbi:permease-like cell division protein FtsX [Candidatus Parcubacteria bacterium]|nr:permease-like cell division protein FtsX [Candidatus Parcubacteria bacterium]